MVLNQNPARCVAWWLLRQLVGFKRSAARLCPNIWLRMVGAEWGTLTHFVPWLIIRSVCSWIPAPGEFSPALNRLLCGLPVYAGWYVFSAWWLREYCLIWVVVLWLALLPIGGLLSLGNASLRRQLRVRHRLPIAWCGAVGATGLALTLAAVSGLMYLSPVEVLRGNAPDFSSLAPAVLAEQLDADEQTLAAVLAGLATLDSVAPRENVSATAPASADPLAPRQAEFLRYRTALLRLAWRYHNHARLGTAAERERAAALHTTASAAAHAATERWANRYTGADRTALDTPLAMREPRHGEALLTPEWVAKLHPFLQPGDILIERANGYHSTGFLPGTWSQLALYVGTAEQLKAAGLDQDLRVQRHLDSVGTADASGHPPAVIAALGNGVVIVSTERIIGAADSVAVLRPKLNPTQRLEMIARAFEYVGKPYDYAFDFAHTDQLVCSELVARAMNGFIDFPGEERAGQPILTADALIHFWASGEGGRQLEFVAFIDCNQTTGECNWASPGDLAGTVNTAKLP